MNAIELIAALKGADEETAMELVERLQCGEIDCSVLPTGKDNAVLQAQIWAQEARTQKGIVEEIGKLVGCANDWEMVDAIKAALSANGGEVEVNSCDGCAAGMPLHHVDPATHRTHMLCTANRYAPPSVAVPEGVDFGLISAVLEDYALLQTSGVIPCANRHSASDANEQAELLDMLTATLAPDRIAEGGDVDLLAFGSGDYTVEVGGYVDQHAVFIAPARPSGIPGTLAHPTTGADKHRVAPDERVMTFPTEAQAFAVAEAIAGRRINRLDGSHPATPSPAQSVEEIQAGALEEYADQLDAVFANAQEAGATDCPAWHAGQFAKDARKQAARLRTAGDEGEGRPTHNGGESDG